MSSLYRLSSYISGSFLECPINFTFMFNILSRFSYWENVLLYLHFFFFLAILMNDTLSLACFCPCKDSLWSSWLSNGGTCSFRCIYRYRANNNIKVVSWSTSLNSSRTYISRLRIISIESSLRLFPSSYLSPLDIWISAEKN